MRRLGLRIPLFIVLLSVSLLGAVNETLPTYHWACNYLDFLQRRGYCTELSILEQPYTRGEVAESVLLCRQQPGNDAGLISDILDRLEREFASEIEYLAAEENPASDVKLGVWTQHDGNLDDDEFVYRDVLRASVGGSIGEHFYAQSAVAASQYDYNDPLYKGYKWRGMSAYTEQAYVAWYGENFQVKFGRDFLRWGPGQSGSLIMSNNCRPMDMVQASAFWGPFRYSFMAAELDPFSGNVRRFLSGHRLSAKLLNGRLEAAVTELVLYGGENQTFNFVYLNPVIFYHGAKKNGAGDNNVLPAVELSVFPLENWQLYGSVLIDDIQVEKTGTSDLEPNEIGWLAGTGWAAPFDVTGLDLNLEYVRIANRTYNTPQYEEIYLHRNVPIGHPLGNDFDHWQFTAQYWPTAAMKVTLDTWYTRNGEGSLMAAWDDPWNDSTLEDGYDEPFPTGVVEKKMGLAAEVNWYFKSWLRFSGNFSWESVDNWQHVKGDTENMWQAQLRAEFNLAHRWTFDN